ncbi:MAG: caspase family protein [Pseudomonadota bacterium]
MNHLKIIYLPILIGSWLYPQFALTADKHALLIGIQDYSDTPFNSLKGPLNDIELTKGVLRERFGFQNKDFIILLDAQATHTGIEKAFKRLIERVRPDDFVYIFYSGHGSQTDDLNGDERSGKDQTWVSYGARSSADNKDKDNYDVLDDEINAWLSALYAKTEKVVFVSDSCHSATVARGPAAPIRAVKDDKRPHLLGQQTYTQPPTARGIRVGAARDHESAIEWPQQEGQYYGLFTWHWMQNLQQAQASDTWNNVFERAYAQIMEQRGIVQQPQIEGNRRQRVLGGGFAAQPATISVNPIADEWVEINAGSLAGVTKGSIYRLYKPQHPQQTLPRLTIAIVEPFSSFGVPEPEGAFQKDDVVIEESHVYHFPAIKVSLEADFPEGKDKPLLQLIKSAFQRYYSRKQSLPAYTLIDDPSQSALRLYLLRPKRKNGQLIRAKADDVLPKPFANQPPELWILTQEQQLLYKNLQIPFDKPTEGVKQLQSHLNKLARVRELKALKSPRGSTTPVSVQVSILNQVNDCPVNANCVRLPNDLLYSKDGPYPLATFEGRTLNKGEILDFSLHNESEEKYYCYLINISPDNAINVIFPNPEESKEYARLNPGEKRRLTEEVVFVMGDIGKETIKVITSQEPIKIWLLEQPGVKNVLNPLERLLNNALHGWRQKAPIEVDEWATGQVTFDVLNDL